MKVFHIESGLGNQMLDYADMIASKKCNPEEEYYIETIVYDIPQRAINMWNGYELEKVFGIQEKNVKSLFSEKQWKYILDDVIKTEFWNKNWAYSEAIVSAFAEQGLPLKDVHPRLFRSNITTVDDISAKKYFIKRLIFYCFSSKISLQYGKPNNMFRSSNSDDYDGHYLSFQYKGNHIEDIENELRSKFHFPLYDAKNEQFSRFLKGCNSVAIHARRGDFLGRNSYCYEYGYFKRAVKFIKKKVSNPVFIFFCDPDSVIWCKKNYRIFGLDDNMNDNIQFVDWNLGKYSFRDMQLMADCKHNIITNSSFGWWGAFLNRNINKITCSPDIRINTTHWF